jgi:hypothetical protein
VLSLQKDGGIFVDTENDRFHFKKGIVLEKGETIKITFM